MDSIGDRLRIARERKLLTQDELSERTGVMKATISRIENGKHANRPRAGTLRALADALEVDVFWLANGEDVEMGKLAA